MLRLVVAGRFIVEEHPSMPEADETGLEEAVLLKLEECARLLVPSCKSDLDGEDICAVCRERCDESLPGSCRTWGLPCNHYFHADCIRPWFERHATCPNCRTEVSLDSIKDACNARARVARADALRMHSVLSRAFRVWRSRLTPEHIQPMCIAIKNGTSDIGCVQVDELSDRATRRQKEWKSMHLEMGKSDQQQSCAPRHADDEPSESRIPGSVHCRSTGTSRDDTSCRGPRKGVIGAVKKLFKRGPERSIGTVSA
jgi:hypothetical protein